MSYETEIEMLEAEWASEEGFFWRIRHGQFTTNDVDRALAKLSRISIPEDGEVSRRLVSLLWYIPIFIHWQIERIHESGGDLENYKKSIPTMTDEIERVLVVP